MQGKIEYSPRALRDLDEIIKIKNRLQCSLHCKRYESPIGLSFFERLDWFYHIYYMQPCSDYFIRLQSDRASPVENSAAPSLSQHYISKSVLSADLQNLTIVHPMALNTSLQESFGRFHCILD